MCIYIYIHVYVYSYAPASTYVHMQMHAWKPWLINHMQMHARNPLPEPIAPRTCAYIYSFQGETEYTSPLSIDV